MSIYPTGNQLRRLFFWPLAFVVAPFLLCGSVSERLGKEWRALGGTGQETESPALEQRTAFLLEHAPPVRWRDPVLWEWVAEVLDAWERSTAIGKARAAYLGLLSSIAEASGPEEEPYSFEASYRERLQQALRIAGEDTTRSRLYRYLAESWGRQLPREAEVRTTVEALYQQALAKVQAEEATARIKLALARLYNEWREPPVNGERPRYPYRNQALAFVREVEAATEVPSRLREEARELADVLLASELEVEITERFAPFTEIRLSVWSRNLSKAEVRMELLEPSAPEVSRRSDLLRLPAADAEGEEAAETATLLEREVAIGGASALNWARTQVALGDSFGAGWYRFTLRAGDHVLRKLVLVSPVELILARNGNATEGMLFNAISGRPPAGGRVILHRADGGREVIQLVGNEGAFRLAGKKAEDWVEILAFTSEGPAWVKAEPDKEEVRPANLILAARSEVQGGEVLRWLRSGSSTAPGNVLFPNGRKEPVRSEELAAGFREESVEIPETTSLRGPLYWTDESGSAVFLAHLRQDQRRPFSLRFTGERLREGSRLFHAGRPVGARLIRNAAAALPEGIAYLRFEVVPAERPFFKSALRQAPAETAPVVERILSFENALQNGLSLQLGAADKAGSTRVYRLRVFSLRGQVLLAEGLIGMTGVRQFLTIRQEEKILRHGQPARLHMEWRRLGARIDGTPLGQVEVVRENFATRYIHRRRGTIITEGEYDELPDRSLLGSAKTDYRFHKREYVRKVVERLDPPRNTSADTVELALPQPGYYTVRYTNRGAETKAVYPDGEVAFWVLPVDPMLPGALQPLQSERPLLLVEPGPDQKLEILVLGRSEPGGVFLHLRNPEGTSAVHTFTVDGPAVYREWEPPEGLSATLFAGRLLYEAVWAGGGRSLYLHGSYGTSTVEPLRLQEGRQFGLAPGSPYRFQVNGGGDSLSAALAWKLYPAGMSWRPRRVVGLQREYNRNLQTDTFDGVAFSGEWLPIADPAGERSPLAVPPGTGGQSPPDWPVLQLLYPELVLDGEGDGPAELDSGFSALACAGEGPCRLSGTLPSYSGRWDLVLLRGDFLAENSLQSWPLSTITALSAELRGPDFLRQGDEAEVLLAVENASGRDLDLQIKWLCSGGVFTDGEDVQSVSIPSGRRLPLARPVQAGAGPNVDVRVRIEGERQPRELRLRIPAVGPSGAITFKAASASGGEEALALEVSPAGQADSRLLAGAGLYPIFNYVWPEIRDELAPVVPLLSSMGDWALLQAKARQRLDPDPMAVERAGRRLAATFRTHQKEDGGLSVHPSLSSDPFLSGLCLWVLRHFNPPPQLEAGRRERLANFAGRELLRKDISNGQMLLYLRGLADPGTMDRAVRPTRLQARRFLDLFRIRNELDAGNLAQLLLLARTFQFREEIQLLETALKAREAGRADAFSSALAYHALAGSLEIPQGAAYAFLGRYLARLGGEGPRTGWRAAAGLLHLMASFRRDGDFFLGGSLVLEAGERRLGTVSLDPGTPERACLTLTPAAFPGGGDSTRWTLSAEGKVPFRYLLALGRKAAGEAGQGKPSSLLRVYREPTLLAGTILREELFEGERPLRTGERLRQVLAIDLEKSHPYLRLEFPVPAGFAFSGDNFRHSGPPAMETSTGPSPDGVILRSRQEEVTFLLPSAAAGTHRFSVDLEAVWPGSYHWPGRAVFPPLEGDELLFTGARRLTVTDGENSGK